MCLPPLARSEDQPPDPKALAGTTGYRRALNWQQLETPSWSEARQLHSGVWTGRDMLVWGGGAYDPLGDRWITISTEAAPSARADHTAFWTGTEMIIWGGRNKEQPVEGGARYNPKLKTWTPLSELSPCHRD